MRGELPPEVVQQLYRGGVTAMVDTGARVASWDDVVCGSWTAAEVARHVLAVARWYHHWLDRAESGVTTKPFEASQMGQRNEAELSQLTGLDGPTAIERFEGVALDYLDRVITAWDTPFAFPYGLVTAGQHCALGAAEWHLHAWDLSQQRYRPASPEALFLATGSAFAAAKGGLPGAALGQLVPIGARRRPWRTLLKQSGRAPVSNS